MNKPELPRWIAFLALAICSVTARAADTPPAADQLNLAAYQDLVRGVVLGELKEEYKDEHNWGHTTTVQKARLKGKWFNAYWEPYTDEVNDGLWERATIRLVEPDKNLALRIVPEQSADPARSAFSLYLSAKIDGEATFVRWRLGVKMLNSTAKFNATIEARVRCDLAIKREPGLLVDDVILDPRVLDVDLKLADFNLDRFGILGRDIASELSNLAEPFIQSQLKKREPKIVAKANVAIEKHRDKLKFSAATYAVSQWQKITEWFTGGPEETKTQ